MFYILQNIYLNCKKRSNTWICHQKLGLSDQFNKCYQFPFEEILAEPKGGVEATKLVLRGIEYLPRINVEEGVTDGRGDSGKGVHPELLSAHLPLIDG